MLFDLDGVLVDSQDAEMLALRRFAHSLGARVPPDDELTEQIAGRRMKESIGIVAGYGDLPVPDDALAKVRGYAEELLTSRLRAVPGVTEALARIDTAKYVVSNSPLDMIIDRLSRTELLAHFPGPHFSAYQYQTWKPDPGIYLEAVKRLNAPTSEAIAIEDSQVGVRSARDAGLRVYWYRPGSITQSRWISSVRIVGNLAQLPELLQSDLGHPALNRG